MRIRKWIAAVAALVLMITAGAGLAEDGVTLRTISCFAGPDGSAEEYVAILKRYESMSGNTVIDNSSIIDETWKTAILKDFAAGNEPDILFFFAAGGDSAPILSRVVSLEEINAAYPDINLQEEDVLREPDGKVYAVPVRGFWEGLFVNTDLFDKYQAPLPKDWASLLEAIRIFRENDIVPIAISLSDVPHYLAEMSVLACATKEEQQARPKTFEEVPASWFEAMGVIRELAEAGAFADNAWRTDDESSTALFVAQKAAMKIDGSWLDSNFPHKMMDSLAVLPMPLKNGEGASSCYVGGVSMGFYLTRRAWDSGHRDAAVELLKELTSEESIWELGSSSLSGKLLDSANDLQTGRQMVSPLQDAMNNRAREKWLLQCIPAVAEGTMTPEECWQRVMALNPFGE